MNKKRIVGIVIAIIGIVMILFSNYIAGQVAIAQQNVQETTSMFSGNRVGKSVGDVANQAVAERSGPYLALSRGLKIGGVILIVVGVGFVVFGGRRKR